MPEPESTETGDSTGPLRLPTVLDTDAADPLQQDILSRRGAKLTLDASDVELLGGRCAEVMLAAAALWKDDRQDLDILDPSAGFLSDAEILGLTLDDMTEAA